MWGDGEKMEEVGMGGSPFFSVGSLYVLQLILQSKKNMWIRDTKLTFFGVFVFVEMTVCLYEDLR